MNVVKRDGLEVDMWDKHRFVPKKFHVDAYFYPHGSFDYLYRGNIYDDAGNTVGDYGANDSAVIEENFIITWKEDTQHETEQA